MHLYHRSWFFLFFWCSILCSSLQIAARHPSTHITHFVGRGIEIEAFHPKSDYKTYQYGNKASTSVLLSSGSKTIEDLAKSYLKAELGIDESEICFKNGYEENGSKFAFLNQCHGGIPFANANANIAWRDNKVISFGSSFSKHTNIPSSKPTVSFADVVPDAEDALDGKYNGNSEAKLRYLAKSDGSAVLVYSFPVKNTAKGISYEAFADAHTGALVSLNDLVSHVAYRAIHITKASILEGQEMIVNPQNGNASIYGWHTATETAGNNVIVQSTYNATLSESGPGYIFDYPADLEKAITDPANVDAALTNAFYVVNTVHDIASIYGFTEKKYNFQRDNYGKGGLGNDPVVAIVDYEVQNNAFFTHADEGESGQITLYAFDNNGGPQRHSAFDNSILVHEVMHGISFRLTGHGGTECLQAEEGRGLGEGYSDAMSDWTRQTSAQTKDTTFGEYSWGEVGGMRKYPYSVSKSVNPFLYSSMSEVPVLEGYTVKSAHVIGTIWATMLHDVYGNLVEDFGYSPTALTDASGPEGNVVFLNNMIAGLSLQPCNPTFKSARDAMILADQNAYNGVHQCSMWRGFAGRGLGNNATEEYVDDFTLPKGCSLV